MGSAHQSQNSIGKLPPCHASEVALVPKKHRVGFSSPALCVKRSDGNAAPDGSWPEHFREESVKFRLVFHVKK